MGVVGIRENCRDRIDRVWKVLRCQRRVNEDVE